MKGKRQDYHFTAEESVCPKYVICDCPAIHLNNEEKCRRINVDHTIEKLRKLVSDPVTSDHVARISRLLSDYLCEIGDDGYVSFDVQLKIKIFSIRKNYCSFFTYLKKHISDSKYNLRDLYK